MRIPHFSTNTKYQTCKLVSIAAVVGAIHFLSKLSPFESGTHNRHYFVISMVIIITGVAAAIGMYFFRSKLRNEFPDTAIQTLGKLGEDMQHETAYDIIRGAKKKRLK